MATKRGIIWTALIAGIAVLGFSAAYVSAKGDMTNLSRSLGLHSPK